MSATLNSAAQLIGLLVGVGGVAVAIAERTRSRSLSQSVLVRRWRTWALIAPLWWAAVVFRPAALLLVAVISVSAIREFCAMTHLPRPNQMILVVGAMGLPLAIVLNSQAAGWVVVGVVLALTVSPLLGQDVTDGVETIGSGLVGLAFIVVPVSALLIVRDLNVNMLLLVGVAVAISDIGAFVIGSTVKGRRLAPRLSPNKTVAGLAGNLLGASAATVLCAAWIPELRATGLIAFPLVVAVGAVWGDLLVSLMKRHAGVKDAGSALPGFGGVLDRVDSMLVVAPLTVVFIRIFG